MTWDKMGLDRVMVKRIMRDGLIWQFSLGKM